MYMRTADRNDDCESNGIAPQSPIVTKRHATVSRIGERIRCAARGDLIDVLNARWTSVIGI